MTVGIASSRLYLPVPTCLPPSFFVYRGDRQRSPLPACQVAFEFIACQQKNHGVLILSEFIGAGQAIGSGAILVNPFNTDALAKGARASIRTQESSGGGAAMARTRVLRPLSSNLSLLC